MFLSHVIGSPCHVVGEYYAKKVSEQDQIKGIVLEPIAVREAFDGAFLVFDLASKSSFLRLNLHQFKCPVVLVGIRCGRRLKGKEEEKKKKIPSFCRFGRFKQIDQRARGLCCGA